VILLLSSRKEEDDWLTLVQCNVGKKPSPKLQKGTSKTESSLIAWKCLSTELLGFLSLFSEKNKDAVRMNGVFHPVLNKSWQMRGIGEERRYFPLAIPLKKPSAVPVQFLDSWDQVANTITISDGDAPVWMPDNSIRSGLLKSIFPSVGSHIPLMGRPL